mgnify:CR=1 FL=1
MVLYACTSSTHDFEILSERGFFCIYECFFHHCYVRMKEVNENRVLTKYLQSRGGAHQVVFQRFEYDLTYVAMIVDQCAIPPPTINRSDVPHSPLIISTPLSLEKAITFYDALEDARLLNQCSSCLS